jgi:hypothetical protein
MEAGQLRHLINASLTHAGFQIAISRLENCTGAVIQSGGWEIPNTRQVTFIFHRLRKEIWQSRSSLAGFSSVRKDSGSAR